MRSRTPLTLNFDQLRRFPGRSVRTVMECSGSDATFFEYFKGEGPKPSRTQEGMILSASEWTGVPLGAVLHEAGLTAKSLYVRAEGNDLGVPPTAAEGTTLGGLPPDRLKSASGLFSLMRSWFR